MSRQRQRTVQSCLKILLVGEDAFKECQSLEAQWKVVKRCYFRRALKTHPDKGGDAKEFRAAHESFETLRTLYEKGKIESFASAKAEAGAFDDIEDHVRAAASASAQSYEYYAAAAKEDVPPYRVEPAKSNRSACQAKGKAKHCADPGIDRGELRAGWMNMESGTYGRWVHLGCWRVPAKVWLGLPDPDDPAADPAKFEEALLQMNEVLLCGLYELSPAQRKEVVAYCMDRSNWAALRRPRQQKAEPETGASNAEGGKEESGGGKPAPTVPPAAPSGSVMPQSSAVKAYAGAKETFVMPKPGVNAPPDSLRGRTVVLTGVFPEVGGGAGLSLGKARVKQMLESFGARVTGSVSGKTDILLCGSAPGFSKVAKARGQARTRLMSLKNMKDELTVGEVAGPDEAPSLMIEGGFSAGFRGNGLAAIKGPGDLARARGYGPQAVAPYNASKAKASTGKKRGPKPKGKATPASKAKAAPKPRAKATPKPGAKATPKPRAKAAPKAKAKAKPKVKVKTTAKNKPNPAGEANRQSKSNKGKPVTADDTPADTNAEPKEVKAEPDEPTSDAAAGTPVGRQKKSRKRANPAVPGKGPPAKRVKKEEPDTTVAIFTGGGPVRRSRRIALKRKRE